MIGRDLFEAGLNEAAVGPPPDRDVQKAVRPLPIRLLPTPPTCRVLPGSGVKLCVAAVRHDGEPNPPGIATTLPLVELGARLALGEPPQRWRQEPYRGRHRLCRASGRQPRFHRLRRARRACRRSGPDPGAPSPRGACGGFGTPSRSATGQVVAEAAQPTCRVFGWTPDRQTKTIRSAACASAARGPLPCINSPLRRPKSIRRFGPEPEVPSDVAYLAGVILLFDWRATILSSRLAHDAWPARAVTVKDGRRPSRSGLFSVSPSSGPSIRSPAIDQTGNGGGDGWCVRELLTSSPLLTSRHLFKVRKRHSANSPTSTNGRSLPRRPSP